MYWAGLRFVMDILLQNNTQAAVKSHTGIAVILGDVLKLTAIRVAEIRGRYKKATFSKLFPLNMSQVMIMVENSR